MENKILNLLKKIIKEDEDTFIDITDMDDDSAAETVISKKDIFKKLRDKMSDKDRTPAGFEYGEIVSGEMGEENIFKKMFGKKEDPEVAREKDRKENPYLGNLGYDYDDIRGWHYVGPGQGRFDNRDSEDMEIEEGMYGSFGDPKRKDFKGDEYYDEKDRPVRSGDIYGIGGDDFDTEEFDTFQQLYDKYGDKQSWFNKRDGETMFNKYREMTGKPFKVKTRKNEIGEAMYGSFGDPKRKDFKGDEYYDEKDRPVRSGDIYGIGGDDFDTEEFDTFQQLYDKYGDKQSWFNKRDGETMFNKYREMTGKPFKVKTRKNEMGENEVGEGNAFSGALANAKKDGKSSFEVDGKTYQVKESKNRGNKEKVVFTESELINFIERLVEDEKVVDKGFKTAMTTTKKENTDAIKQVAAKMKDYMKNMGTDYEENPKSFPKGNKVMSREGKDGKDISDDVKKAYKASEKVEEYIENLTASALENIDYDNIKPNEDWITDNIEGSSRTGNSQEYANAVPTDVNKKRNEIRKNNLLGALKRQAYNKSPQPTHEDEAGEMVPSNTNPKSNAKVNKIMATESIEDKKILNEMEKMKNLIGYNRKTQ